RPRFLYRAPGSAEFVQAQRTAGGNLAIAQCVAQQGVVPVEFGHMVAETLERAERVLDLVTIGALARQLGFADHGAGSREAIGGGFEYRPAFRLRFVPMRGAAEAEPGCALRH